LAALIGVLGFFTYIIPDTLKFDFLFVMIPLVPLVIQWPGLSLESPEDASRCEKFVTVFVTLLFLLWLAGIMAPAIIREFGPQWLETQSGTAGKQFASGSGGGVVYVPFQGLVLDREVYVGTVNERAIALVRSIEIFRRVMWPIADTLKAAALYASLIVLIMMVCVEVLVYRLKSSRK
jgi:hypothetical protein